MKTILGTLAAVMVLCASPSDIQSDKQDVLAAMNAYKEALIHRDGGALNKLLANDLSYVHSAGQVETKTDVIQSITKAKTTIEKVEFLPDTTVRIHGHIAYVSGKVDLWHSSTDIVHMNVLHVWEKGSQGWQLVARQATKLAN